MLMSRRGRRARGERGAAVVEFAILVPLLLLVVLGIIEMGLLMRDSVAANSAVRSGARTASAAAGAGPGTCQASANPPPCTPVSAPALAQAAADAMQSSGLAIPTDDIEWITIYAPGANGFPLGRTDIRCNGATRCVTYVWDSNLSGGKFRYSSGSWDSKSVNACLNDVGRDSVGVGMRVNHKWVSKLFGSSMDLDEHVVMQFEPLEADRCKPGTPNAHP